MKNQITFAHIGDLHITKAKEQNYIDLLSIIAQIETECSKQLDFVFLPGDNADNGLPEQYKLVETALKMLSIPVYIIPGDHDMEQGSLGNFDQNQFTKTLPMSAVINGYRCIFLDVSGRGKGGPDFRLLADQLNWLETELETAAKEGTAVALFMHTYPADLKDNAEIDKLNHLIAQHDIVLVDMGHTHYNELSNDGHTIFSATRSTGQIEEGPVGYSLVTITDKQVSWRFKPLQEPFPYVMITAPEDYRLLRSGSPRVDQGTEVSALIFGSRQITQVRLQTDVGDWKLMEKQGDYTYKGTIDKSFPSALVDLIVEAVDDTGRPGIHNIRMATANYQTPTKQQNGSNDNAVGAWPENGIFGTQLGPNQNGKPSS